MTEQKRPVLTLKRKTEGETPVRSRKTIINVTTPPKWKVKKQKLAEKAAREAELAAKKAQVRQALSIYLNLPTLDEAVNTLKPWWPGLFDGDTPRLLACGIRPRSHQWWQLFRMVSQWHVDVVIVERRSFSIVAAVELDDASHLRPERRRRDILLEEVLRQAGIPLLRSHDARKLLQMTGEWLNTTGAAQQSPEHRS
ncbi:fertility inhibition protein FinO [Escherichia coli]